MATENADNINSENTSGSEEVQVQLIDGVCVVTTNDVSSTLASPIVIEKPAAGQTTTFDAVGGQKYVFDFSENNVDSFIQEGDDLTLSFADGSSIQLIGFGTASSSAIPTTLAFTGEMTPSELQSLIRVVDAQPAIEELEVIEEEPQADVRGEEQADSGEGETGGDDVAQIEPAAGQEDEITPEELAQVQEELAQIEPAAGDAGGAGASADAGGAGFQSSFTPQGVIPIEDIGPIGPTALQYQIPEFREDIFAQEQDDQPDILSPAALNLDETNLDGGPIVLGGNVNVSFGNDGPGTISPDGSFSSGGSQTGGTLSSNGNLIDVTPTADGYVGTINGGADTVFEITINPNTGAFEFTQFLPIDHADDTDANDVVTLNFGVVATDADGDAANTSITVNIADDAPAIAAPDENTVDETTLSGGPIVVNDTLVVDFGQDGPGDVTPSGTTNVTGVGTLASNGQPITITQTATGYEGTLPGGAPAFTLTIDPATGGYTYTQFVPVDHDVVTDTISIDFGVNVTDFDTDSTATTITINIVDSVPEIKDDNPEIGKGIENVDETNLPGGSTASGSLDVDFGTDLPAQIVPDGNTTVTGSVAGGSLTSNGADVTITQTADGYVGTINGGADTVFTFTIDPTNGDYVFNQLLAIDHADGTDANDIITITFGVVAEDSDGDSDSGSVTINIADDGPQVSDSTAPTINENTVDTAPITVNGSVNPDFGADGAGDVQPNGTTSVNGVTTLTSNGEAITVTQTANGYVGTLAGGGTAFELTLNPATGEYEFTQFVALDHETGNDIITLNFGVTGTDFDTDTDTATISINIKDSVPEINDNPKLGDGLEVVDETDLPGVTASGQLTVDFGSDLPGAVTADGSFTSGGSQLNGALTSNGEPVTVTLVGDTYTGTANGQTIFTLQIDTDGSYNFTLLGTLDHADPNDPNDIIDLEFGVVATDGDGDTDSTTILIKVKDDVPVIGDAAGDVDESNFDNGPLSTSDTLFTDFGTEVGTIAPDGNAIAEANGNPIALTSNGDAVTITQTADGYVGTTNGGGTTVFTITVDATTGQYVYTQFETLDHPDGTDPNDTIELSFGVAVTSTDGDSDTGTITISVGDDGPVANDEFSGAEEGQLVTGNLLTNDELSEDADNTVTNVEFDGTDYPITAGGFVTITTTLGEITINSDGTYTYIATDLGDPDGTDVFTYTLTDGDGDSDTAELSVRVTPDGEPVAVTEEMTVDETNLTPGPLVINESIALDFGLDGAGTFDPNGDFQFGGSAANNALTSNGVPVIVTQTTDGYVGTIQGTTDVVFELTVQDNGDYTFELFNTLDHADATDPNDTIVLDFGVTLTDIDGDTADGTITINVLDDAPVAFDDTNTVPENQLTANGNVTDNDINGEDAPSTVTSISFNGTQVPVVVGTATTINGQYGTLEINADGTYTYTSFGTNTTAVQDVFTYSLTDFDGDTDTAELKINITDIDVQPEVIGSEVTVDETDLDPTDDASNTVTANFGVDGPGTITVSGANTFTFDGAENNALTSNGTPVTVTTQGNTYVGTAGTETIFTLVLDQNTGDYTFTLFGTLDHADETNPDDIIELTFGVTATDSDGDTETGTITVNVKDDGPYINTKAAPIDEDGLVNGPISYTRTLNHDYGEDGAGEIHPDGTFMAVYQMGGQNQTLTSDGSPITVTQTANGYVGESADGRTIFTVEVQNNGQYTYTQFDGIDHPDANNPDDVIWLKFGVEIVDYDGDTDTAFIQVDVHDAAPTAPNNSVFPVAEHGLENGPVVVMKNFNGGDFGGDGEGQYEFNGTFMLAGNSSTAGDELTSNGESIEVTFNGNIATGTTAGGTVVFTMEIDPVTGKHTFTLFEALDHGKTDASGSSDVVWVKFGVDIVDADGDRDSAMIQVDIRDDAPDAVDDVNTLADNQPSVDGNVIPNDDLSADDPNTVTKISFGGTTKDVVAGTPTEIDGQFGKLSINADGSYTYTSFGTNTVEVQDVFTYTLTDFDGDFDLATLTITLQDVDDQPIIADVQPLIVDETDLNPTDDDSNIITANFGDDAPGTFSVTGTGTFSFSGAENNQLTSNGVPVDVAVDGNDYVGTAGGTEIFRLTLNANTGEYEFTLSGTLDHADETNPDDIIELNFGVTATDSDGDTDTGSIVVQVKDDGPSINTKAGAIDEDGLVNGAISYTRTLNHDYGEDGQGEINPDGTFMAVYQMGGQNQTLTSDGEEVIVTQTADGYIGQTAGGDTIFTVTVQNNGQYTYTQFAGLDHPDPNNGDDVIWLKFGVEIVDYDGDTDTAFIQVDVHDAMPTAPNNSVFPVAEHGLENGPVIVTRNFNGGDFGGDGEGQYEYDGTFMLLGNSSTAGDELTSNGEKVDVVFNGNVATGQLADGTVIFTMELDPATGKHTFTLFEALDHGKADASGSSDVVWAKFGVNIVDADGDSKSAMIQVDIRDDAPDAIDDTDTVADNETSTSGNVIPNDDLSADDPNTVTEISFGGTTKTVVAGTPTEIDGQYGKLVINANGSYTYTTFGTNTAPVQEVFTYTLTDYDGDHDDATLTIDVASVDEQPELTTSEVTVDETDLDPTDDASNTVTADFGSDAPGTYTVSGAGSFNFNGAENNQLTSGGVPVTVSVQGNSYVGTAGTETVFTLELNQTTGQYTFTLIGTLDHADETNPDDVIQLFFDVDATDSDGDTDTGTITVNVKDDGPTIQGKASAIDEDGLVNGPISYTRTLNHDYGEDGAGEIRPTDTFMATFSMGGSAQTITSDGVPVAIETTANGYVGKANGQTIFTLEVQTNGQYTYTQYAGLDHPDTNNDDDVMWLKFGVEIVDYDGDTAPATITVDVHDSAPTAPNNSVFPVAEHGLENGPVVVMRNFNGGDFGGDGEGQYEYNGTFMLLGNSSTATDELTSGGEKVEVTFNGNVATGTTVGGTVVFTMELDPTTGKHTFTLFQPLDHGKTDASGSSDVVWAKFGVDIVDADGDRDSAMIQVDIRDDAPEAGANSVFPVSEAGLINGPVEVTRDLDGDFHADGEGQYEYNGTFMLLGNSSTATDELTSGGEKVEVTFNGNVATGTTTGGTVVFTMELDPSTGEHTFTLFEALDHGKPDASGAQDVVWAKFGVDIVDADGDRDSTMIQVDIRDHAPIAKDDCNEFEVEVVNKDFNVVMALDVSGSMSGDKIALLKSSVNNLLTDFNGYNGGEIKVHLVPFATYAGAGETFTITDTADLNAALAYIDGLWADGTTNYEQPLQSAINWLNGVTDNDPIAGADTYTYFVSDGSPNRYLDANGQLAAGNADQVMGEITGSDGSDEVGILQGLSTEVIGVGIGVDGATLARLGQIDSDGTALDVQDPTDLEAMLQATSPIKGSTSGNVITGEHGGPGAADMLSADADNTVTQIRFGTQTINLPTDGSNVAINGDYGTLTINSTGEYGYELFDAAYSTETSYVFTKFNPPGSDNGGDIKKVQTSYNETTESLSFEMVIDPVSEGFTLALNNGPNPKGHGGELALIYFDASGTEPVITVYAYNGANTQTSYKDGSAATGTQTPDKILSSITDPDAFDITVTTDANGNKVFSFDMDASTIQAHDPIHGPNGDWSGVSFDESVGIWLHPVKNLDTEYNSDGFLSNWTGSNGYYDTSNQKTVEHTTTDGSTSDQFEYVLTDGDGDSDVATLTLKSTAAESSVFTGSDSADVIEGTDEGDVIAGGLGNDTLYGGEGADTFLFNALNEGVDTIKDFDAAEGDNFDVGALIQGYDALQDSIDDFVFTTEQGGDTVVSVDPTGSGNAANATQIAILEAVTGLSADDIVGDDNSQTTV